MMPFPRQFNLFWRFLFGPITHFNTSAYVRDYMLTKLLCACLEYSYIVLFLQPSCALHRFDVLLQQFQWIQSLLLIIALKMLHYVALTATLISIKCDEKMLQQECKRRVTI